LDKTIGVGGWGEWRNGNSWIARIGKTANFLGIWPCTSPGTQSTYCNLDISQKFTCSRKDFLDKNTSYDGTRPTRQIIRA